jgi:hypothetical protein
MQASCPCVHRPFVHRGVYQASIFLATSLAVVATSSLLIVSGNVSGNLATQSPSSPKTGLMPNYSTGIDITTADRAQADRSSGRLEVLIAAFVPAPKHPPKVTQGTGSR